MPAKAGSKADNLALRIALAEASDDVLLSRTEVAAFLGINPAAVSNAVYAGRLPPPVKIGGGRRGGISRWLLGDMRAAIKTPMTRRAPLPTAAAFPSGRSGEASR